MIYVAVGLDESDERTYLLTTAVEYNDVLVIVNGMYPKALDKVLRQRFLDASRGVTLVPLAD